MVIKPHGKDKYGHILWLCKCDCGNEKIIYSSNLLKGTTKSCGCLMIKHGHCINYKYSKTYESWRNMLQRCGNPSYIEYEHYGGRGITACERWLKFENFLEDIGEKPSNKYQIDRIDNNKGYYKENCRWVLSENNNKNKRNNIMIPLNKELLCLKDYCRKLNLNYQTISTRIYKGQSIEKALTTPIRKKNKL